MSGSVLDLPQVREALGRMLLTGWAPRLLDHVGGFRGEEETLARVQALPTDQLLALTAQEDRECAVRRARGNALTARAAGEWRRRELLKETADLQRNIEEMDSLLLRLQGPVP